MKMVVNAQSRMPLVAKLSANWSFHGPQRSSNHLLLLRKTSVSNCCYSIRFCCFQSLSSSPLHKDDDVAWSKRFSDWELCSFRSLSSSPLHKDDAAWSKRFSDWDLKSSPPMPFDICQGPNILTTSEEEEEQEEEVKGSATYQPGGLRLLRPGMVLLKQYLTQDEQVSIVRDCRRLGLGPGGFYWPRMRLMLMCLGLDWDPHTRKYNKRRRFDQALVPDIPHEFLAMVNRAVNAGQALTERKHQGGNVKDVLPMLSPDICIVNFYTAQGRLGLHQDRDESRASLAKGLPIVSFSLGNSAEFFYGDVRDIDKATKVVLESGDVVIFGGPSRHIFHGVQSIIPHTAPDFLLKKTNLLPGRLNLTFRQY